jgi:hypothetical protein
LPEFTSPLGSRNVTFCKELTENEASVSARELLFGVVGPFAATVPFGVAGVCAATGAFLARKSSAQDFGGPVLGGGDDLGVSSTLSSALVSAAGGTPFSSVEPFSAPGVTGFSVADVALGARAGLMGIRGMAGIVAVRLWPAVAGRAWGGGIAEDGVVGWVESASDGSCDVEGVSMSEPAAIVDA